MGLRRKLKDFRVLIRQFREATPVAISSQEIKQLNFYQFKKKSTSEFFYNRLNKTKIKVADTPHYALAEALNSGNARAINDAESYFSDYLRASWNNPPIDKIKNRILQFRGSFDYYKNGGIKQKILLTSLPTDTEYYVVDGNHRSAIAAALGIPLRGSLWPADLTFLKYSHIPEFYGTDRKDMPYQSITLNEELVIPGRRNDLKERLSMLPAEVISGNKILDVACNVGMSSLLAKAMGAESCTGIEISQKMVSLATRLAMFSGAYPSVSYREFNIDNENFEPDQIFDTAFMFSIYSHLKNPSRLVDIVKKNVRRYVVFEGHPGGKESDYADFFNSGAFSSVKEIGRLNTSRFKNDSKRILWLCER